MEVEVTQEQSGSRIDRLLGRIFYPDYSRSYLTAMIDAGRVQVNGGGVRKNYRVAKGDLIHLDFPERVDETPAAEDLPLKIIFEDEDLIVLDKPEGMVIHPGTGSRTGTLVNAILLILWRLLGR